MLSNQNPLLSAELLFKKYPQIDSQQATKALSLCKNQNRALFMMNLMTQVRLGTKSVLATILVDASPHIIKENFDTEVLELVIKTKKCINLYFPANIKKNKEEDVVTILIAYAEDLRVVFLVIIYTIYFLKFEKGYFSRKEIKNILRFVPPLCHRLNLWNLKVETENLCLQNLNPHQFAYIESKLNKIKTEKTQYIQNCFKILEAKFKEKNIPIQTSGRIKDIYSIYKKIKLKKIQFKEIYDLIALRIVVKNEEDCYRALKIVHSLWQPHFERIKDYIAVPKPNNYQSLHTTVLGPENHYFEIQIRTKKMDYEANYGIAAHWSYSKNKRSSIEKSQQPFWLKNLLRLQQYNNEIQLEDLHLNFYQKRVFIFTAQGDIVSLPKGSCVIDLAFYLNASSALRLQSCAINQKQKPLQTILKNGDLVKIVYAKKYTAETTWLKQCKTEFAKNTLALKFKDQIKSKK